MMKRQGDSSSNSSSCSSNCSSNCSSSNGGPGDSPAPVYAGRREEAGSIPQHPTTPHFPFTCSSSSISNSNTNCSSNSNNNTGDESNSAAKPFFSASPQQQKSLGFEVYRHPNCCRSLLIYQVSLLLLCCCCCCCTCTCCSCCCCFCCCCCCCSLWLPRLLICVECAMLEPRV